MGLNISLVLRSGVLISSVGYMTNNNDTCIAVAQDCYTVSSVDSLQLNMAYIVMRRYLP